MRKKAFKKVFMKAFKWMKPIAIMLIAGLILSLCFYLLLLVSFSATSDKFQNNLAVSYEIIEDYEGYDYYHFIASGENPVTRLDNQTDAAMIKMAENPGGGNSVFYNALTPEYPRYWHGYLVILRPLLQFFDITQIRYLLEITNVIVFALLLCLMNRKSGMWMSVLYAASFGLVNGFIGIESMQSSNMILLSEICAVCLLLIHEKIKDYMYIYFFAVGALTAFFDFLTTPLLTLLIPAVIYFCLFDLKQIKQIKLRRIWANAAQSCTWFLGYVSLWSAKWMIAGIALHENVFLNAIDSAQRWTGAGEETLGYTAEYAIYRNLEMIFPAKYVNKIIFLLVVFTTAVIMIGILKKKTDKAFYIRLIPLVAFVLLPVGWLIALKDHVSVHTYFTYRVLMASLFAGGILIVMCVWRLIDAAREKGDSGVSYKD